MSRRSQARTSRVDRSPMPGVWCVDVPTLPTYIDEGDEPYRPQACMFVDGATGLALPPRLHRHVDAPALAAAFDEAVANTGALRIAPPTMLHADNERVAELCRAALGSVCSAPGGCP